MSLNIPLGEEQRKTSCAASPLHALSSTMNSRLPVAVAFASCFTLASR